MQTGTKVSAAGHGILVFLALFGLPWFGPREREAIRVTEVSFVSEAEFAAAQSAAPEAPRAPDAPATPPAPRPAPAAARPAAEPEAAEPTAPEVVATLQAPEPEPQRITPRVVTLAPPTAAVPPRARPEPRVEPEPTPPPPDTVRPAEEPVAAPEPSPQAEVERPEEAPAAPPEAAPETAPEPEPPATLALETSGRPVSRPRDLPRPETQQDQQADTVMASLKREVDSEIKRRSTPTATPATLATEPTVSEPTEPAGSTATALPVGPPMSSSEKNGLKLAVQKCWNVPAGLRDAQQLKVTIGAELAADGGVIRSSIRLVDPSPAPDGRFQQAYEAGRRALIRCSPYADLPREKYGQWRNIEVVFNPEGMVSW